MGYTIDPFSIVSMLIILRAKIFHLAKLAHAHHFFEKFFRRLYVFYYPGNLYQVRAYSITYLRCFHKIFFIVEVTANNRPGTWSRAAVFMAILAVNFLPSYHPMRQRHGRSEFSSLRL